MFASGKSASVSAVANYIEDVFSTWLYTGSSSAQTITNGIDLLNKGGLVWLKGRNVGSAYGYGDHELFDSANVGSTRKYLRSDGTDALGINGSIAATPFTASGFNLDAGPEINNRAGDTNVSWTFRKQPKFFDVVTYTGTGSNRTIAHNLGSTPGVIIIKQTSAAGQDWPVYHRSLGPTYVSYLDLTNAASTSRGGFVWNNTAPTSTVFSVGIGGEVNSSGETYVAYLFAHDAGGFGLTGNDNVISCGSFTTDGSGNATVSLGYEPQWVMVKASGSTSPWWIFDNMRGFSQTNVVQLNPNTSNAENNAAGNYVFPTATGFQLANNYTGLTSTAFIYIAIRRGPMKVPTDGTKVFNTLLNTGDGTVRNITGLSFPPDLVINGDRDSTAPSSAQSTFDRLRGANNRIKTTKTDAEDVSNGAISAFLMNGYTLGANPPNGSGGGKYAMWSFGRAPGFFDEVCYSGAGTQALTHNLGVVPEMFILKNRAGGTDGNWIVYHAAVGNTAALQLNLTAAPATTSVYFANTSPTSTVFTVGTNQSSSGGTYVAYLFASAPGVSKVGSYTGNGSNQTINCGFTGGARFVLIKRTDDTGDWYVWDSVRGIVSGNDPHLSLNTTVAEVTTDDSVDTDSTGFVVNQLSATNINVTSATYIFLAIA
jgi:hypothetical protein